jgi:hypothetical protein
VAEGEADCVVLLRWVKVLEQGDPSLVWDEPGVTSTVPTPTATNEQGEEIVDCVLSRTNPTLLGMSIILHAVDCQVSCF